MTTEYTHVYSVIYDTMHSAQRSKRTFSMHTKLTLLGADQLTFEGGGGGDLLLAGNFFLGSLCARFFFYPITMYNFFFATLSFAAFFFQ